MIMKGCGQKENDGRQYSPFNMSQQSDTKHCYLSYTSAHTNSLTTGQMFGHNNIARTVLTLEICTEYGDIV